MTRKLTPTERDLLGVWDLVSFEITSPEGVSAPWAREVTGKLIYSDSGYVTCSINGSVEKLEPTLEDLFDSILFYCATFEVAPGGALIHRVCNASDRNRVGRVMERSFVLEKRAEGVLMTVTSTGAYGTAMNVWRRQTAPVDFGSGPF